MKFSVSSVLLQLLPWGTLGDFGGSHFFSHALASRSLMPCKVPLVGKECMFFSSFSTQTLSSFWTSLATMIGVSCAWSWFVIPNRIWHQSLSMGIQHKVSVSLGVFSQYKSSGVICCLRGIGSFSLSLYFSFSKCFFISSFKLSIGQGNTFLKSCISFSLNPCLWFKTVSRAFDGRNNPFDDTRLCLLGFLGKGTRHQAFHSNPLLLIPFF